MKARQRLRESETELSRLIYERGVDDRGFGRIRSKGDQVLLGGYITHQIKDKWGSPQNRPLADFASLIVINASCYPYYPQYPGKRPPGRTPDYPGAS